MGVHTGEGHIVGDQGDQYESHTLNRCARLMAVAHGEQSFDALVPELDATMTAARETMGDTAFRTACEAGAALSCQEAGELASDLIAHARAQLTSTE